MAVVPIVAQDATSFQKDNLAGYVDVLVQLAVKFTGSYPNTVSNGEATTGPDASMVSGDKMIKLKVPQNSIKVGAKGSGKAGYQGGFAHSIEFDFAGFEKETIGFDMATTNAGLIFLVPNNNGQYELVGSTDKPVYLTDREQMGGQNPEGDEKGWKFKGEAKGNKYPILTLSSGAISGLEVELPSYA
jgi:hypothetical protein